MGQEWPEKKGSQGQPERGRNKKDWRKMGLAEMNVNWDQMFEEQGLEQIRQKVGDSIETR